MNSSGVVQKRSSESALSSSQKWKDIWLDLLSRHMQSRNFSKEKTEFYYDTIQQYLILYPSAPKFIPIDSFTRYLYQKTLKELKAYLFFYSFIKDTAPYQLAIKRFCHLARLQEELSLKNYTTATKRNYTTYVKEFLYTLPATPKKDSKKEAKEYLLYLKNEKQLAPRTINLASAALAFYYSNVLGSSLMTEKIPRMKTGRKLPNVYSEKDIARILTSLDNVKHQLVLYMAYGCGLRLNEIRLLKPEHFDFDRRIIKVKNGKGNKERYVMMDQKIENKASFYLRKHKDNCYFFEGYKTGIPLSKRTIEKIYENACSKGNVTPKGGIHTLRHSFATHLLEHGSDLRYIQELLGHSSSKTTEIYTHVSKENIAKIKSPLSNISL